MHPLLMRDPNRPAARRARSQALSRGQSVKTSQPYFSVGRFTFDEDTGVYTLLKGAEVKLFSYKVGEDMRPAGRDGESATLADTNLVVGGQTIDSECVTIVGFAIQAMGLGAVSDPLAALHAAPNISVAFVFNGGKRTYQYGNLEMIPGANGYFGSGTSAAAGDAVGAMTSGWPTFGNFFKIPEGIDWNPASQADSSMTMLLKAERDVTFEVDNDTPPASVNLDLRAQLFCVQQARRSTNQ